MGRHLGHRPTVRNLRRGRKILGSKLSYRRGDLGEEVWGKIAHLLPEGGCRGGRWREHRQVVGGILWKLRTGAPWRDVPECYGPWQTCYDRFVRWRRDGTWDRLLAHAQGEAHVEGEVSWEVSVDSTTCRAHQHASGARSLPSREDVKRGYFTLLTKLWGAVEAA